MALHKGLHSSHVFNFKNKMNFLWIGLNTYENVFDTSCVSGSFVFVKYRFPLGIAFEI